jgi:preprotein translocase subunit SecA
VQRSYFYGTRQKILEGRNLQEIIFDLIGEAVEDAVASYLDRDYVPSVISGWVKEAFNTYIDPSDLRDTDLGALENTIKDKAHDAARDNINTSLSEFLDPDADPADWDYSELSSWAGTYYGVDLPVTELRKLGRDEIAETLVRQAIVRIDAQDVSPVARFLVQQV